MPHAFPLVVLNRPQILDRPPATFCVDSEGIMKRLAPCIATIAGLMGTSALAADMAVKAPPPVATAPASSWTGFYVGAALGAKWADTT